MNILGISCNYHDAAACVVRDGVPIAAAEEERFSRVKHDPRFPEHAIRYCLKQAGISAREVSCVAFHEKPARKLERALVSAKAHFPASEELVADQYSQLIGETVLLPSRLNRSFDYEGPIYYSEHHLSHAASAFYCAPFDDAAILIVDGVGEWATSSQFIGSGARLLKQREIRYPHSVGLLYSALTSYLGFDVNDDEYKVMGLASYGEPGFLNEFSQLIRSHSDGSFELCLDYFSFMYDARKMYSPALVDLLGPARTKNAPIEKRHCDIAASLQRITEDTVVGMARACREPTNIPNLCMAGGVAYNCVANFRIAERAGFEKVFVQPAAGDSGAALGAALWVYHEVLNGARQVRAHNTLLGPEFSDTEIVECLEKFGVAYQHLEQEDLCRRTAGLIADDLVVGWFQGRMEFGPRALGGRSILANPCSPMMKETLNRRVKFREEFRPFAPAVLEEAASEYFEMNQPSPFMLFAPRVRTEAADKIPSVTHVDGTARVQTVSRQLQPRFHRLISDFQNLTGVPMVINTSFNIRGEPIVCTPTDALKCFLGTDIDFLVIGDYLVSKQ